MKDTDVITIPKHMTGREELVVLPRREYERLTEVQKKRKSSGKKKEMVTEEDVLRWSREARELYKEGKLRKLRSLKDLR